MEHYNFETPTKQSRKRKDETLLSMELKLAKLPALGEDCPDDNLQYSSNAMRDFEEETEEMPIWSRFSGNQDPEVSSLDEREWNNFRRFSTRDRKKTEFFCPKLIDYTRNGDISSKKFKSSRPKVFENACRALQFDQRKEKMEITQENTLQPYTVYVDKNLQTVDTTAVMGKSDRSILRPPQSKVFADNSSLICHQPFPIGCLVWGKIPGYDWWPGYIISYDKKDPEKGDEEEEDDEEEEEEEGRGSNEVAWVKWFGDNQLSQLSFRKLFPLDLFTEHINPFKMKGLYKRAIFSVLREAAKRCDKDVASKSEDKKPSWVFYPAAYVQLNKNKSLATQPIDGPEKRSSDLSQETDPEMFSLFTTIQNGEDKDEKVKKGRKTGLILLTGIEKDLLEWALGGFLPTGPDGFKPRPEHLVDVKVISMDGGNELDGNSTHSGGDSNERGGRGSGGKNKLMLVEMRSKAQFELVYQGQIDIEDICIGCGRTNIVDEHPLFHGGLCKHCKESFMECAYLFDEDGTQMYCTICSAGNEVFMCDTPNCSKVYCGPCIEKLCGHVELQAVKESKHWQCYMCTPNDDGVGMMKRREGWDKKLHELFLNDNEMQYEPPKFYPPISAEERKPIRVLGLFDGIGTGLLVLKELGIEVELYVASEIDPDSVKVSRVQHLEIIHVGAIEYITEKEVKAWGPFDIVMGGSPCNDLSIVNPARKGIYDGTGKLFFEFFRILSYAKPGPENQRPFFWLYENVVSMRAADKQIMSRFLECNPVIVDARDISAAHRARYFWGNLPGMNRPAIALPGDRLSLQECLETNCFRTAQFAKLRTITTKMNSIKQTKKAIFPVKVSGEIEDEEGDVLWCTEMERLFGFPDHYTDVANLGRCGRQKLLGKAWSVPVIRHLLSPLKDYFKSNTTGVPSSVKFGTATDSNNLLPDDIDTVTPPSVVTPAIPVPVEGMVNISQATNGAYSTGLSHDLS